MTEREKFEAWFERDFHPDITGPYVKNQLLFAWQAATASTQEQMAALEAAEKRIKELEREKVAMEAMVLAMRDDMREARTLTVKLPQRYDLTGDCDGNGSLNEAEMVKDDNGCWLLASDVVDMVRASSAGIKLQIEE